MATDSSQGFQPRSVVGCHRFRVSVRPCITCIAFLFLLNFIPPASAHTLDTSYARVAIGSAEVEFKFTYDLLTLARITKLDTDGDGAISRGELAAATPAIQKFLRAHIYLELNQREAEFADAVMPAWPDEQKTVIPQSEYAQRLVTFGFRNPVLGEPED